VFRSGSYSMCDATCATTYATNWEGASDGVVTDTLKNCLNRTVPL
jgi:hypothetical protein